MTALLFIDSQIVKRAGSLALCCAVSMSSALAQQTDIAPLKPSGNALVRPYRAAEIPPARVTNGSRLRVLMRAGNLYLTAQDAIALALESNLELESDRYNALISESNLRRFEAGGALPGVPTGNSQVTSVTSGQGVSGVTQAAGVNSGGGGNSNSGNTVGATISQIGPTTPTLDPVVQQADTFSHLSAPQANARLSGVENLIQSKRRYFTSISQGLITGGQVSLSFSDSYLNENAPTDILNPTSATVLQLSVRQNLLQGFGIALNSRNITVAKSNVEINDLNFKTEVIGVVANVLTQYYSLVADYQDLSAKRGALEVARRLYEDNKKQVQVGTMTPLDVTQAEAQVAGSLQDLSTSQATLEQQQVSLKNLLSRDALADPVVRDAQIIPLDTITVPEHESLPALKDLIATAYAKRADLLTERMNVANSKISATGTANGVLPQLAVLANASTQGVAGEQQYVPVSPDRLPPSGGAPGGAIPPGFVPCPPNVAPSGTICETADPYFIGGVGKALGQTFRRNFPSQNVGAFLAPVVRNRQAQADYAIDQLSLKQQELSNARHINQVAVDVSTGVVALQQARARYQAALKNRELQQELLIAEQKKFSLGASTTFLVVQQQRDLATAQATEISDLATYSTARIALDETLGTTLDANNVSMEEGAQGRVQRQSHIPDNVPNLPRISTE
jgi:outer membrane protein TolC